MKDPKTVARMLVRSFLAVVMVLASYGCGASSGTGTPDSPQAVINVDSWLVDVGGRYRLDAKLSVDPTESELTYFWTLMHPLSNAEFEDQCDGSVVASCTTNADCGEGDSCLSGKARKGATASFVADVPGPYTVRLLVETSQANDLDSMILDTYPSLFVLGSLFAFGGTQGALIGEFADGATFAAGAADGVANPVTGNLLIAVPDPGVVREFDFHDGSVLGTFGETANFVSQPVALAFDSGGRLYVAEVDGTVRIFDGKMGLFIDVFTDVTASGQSVRSMVFAPDTGNLLVVDGGAGEGVRVYDPQGSSLGVLGDTATVVSQAVDLVFRGDPATDLLIADAAGDVIRCDLDGTACGSFGTVGSFLFSGGPTSIAVNPAGTASAAEVLVADSVAGAVIGCLGDGSVCSVFGDTGDTTAGYRGILFAPATVPTTTTTTTTNPHESTTTITTTSTSTTTSSTTTTLPVS